MNHAFFHFFSPAPDFEAPLINLCSARLGFSPVTIFSEARGEHVFGHPRLPVPDWIWAVSGPLPYFFAGFGRTPFPAAEPRSPEV